MNPMTSSDSWPVSWQRSASLMRIGMSQERALWPIRIALPLASIRKDTKRKRKRKRNYIVIVRELRKILSEQEEMFSFWSKKRHLYFDKVSTPF